MVVDVEALDVVEESAVEEELVDAGWVGFGLVTATAVEAEDESLLLLHAAIASAATMNVIVDLVYFTVSLSSADALFERGSVTNMCSSPRRQ
ncbi:MAG: hypothetical protein QOH53_454 [Ilumatobacteraceae bacterium]